MTAYLRVKLSKPATVIDLEGRAFQFLQKRPGIAIKDPTDKLKGPVSLFPEAEASLFASKFEPVQPVIDDSHRGLQGREES